MKTPGEILSGMEHCYTQHSCNGCPYVEDGCVPALWNDGFARLRHLEEENMCMKIQMQGDCGVCKHRHYAQVRQDGPHFYGPCHSCIQKETRPNWEYEGLPEVKCK